MRVREVGGAGHLRLRDVVERRLGHCVIVVELLLELLLLELLLL